MSRKRKEKWYQVFRTKPNTIFWFAIDASDREYGNQIRLGQPASDYKAYRMLMYNMQSAIETLLDNGQTITFVHTGERRDGLQGYRNERGVV